MKLKLLFKSSSIIDNNVLIDFFELDQLQLLFSVFGKVGIPKQIFDSEVPLEVKEKLSNFSYELCNMTTTNAFSTYANLDKNSKYKKLSFFDKVAISIAKEYDYYCSSNDGPIRKACEDLSIKYTGTLGILYCSFENNLISKEELRLLIMALNSSTTTCYIRSDVLTNFLEQLDVFTQNEISNMLSVWKNYRVLERVYIRNNEKDWKHTTNMLSVPQEDILLLLKLFYHILIDKTS